MSDADKRLVRKFISWLVAVVVALSGVIGTMYSKDVANTTRRIQELKEAVAEVSEKERECADDRLRMSYEIRSLERRLIELEQDRRGLTSN